MIRRDKTITSRHIKFLEDKRVTVILARLAIIVEKQLDNSGKTAKEIIDYLIDSSEERRLEKDKKEIPTEPKVIDKLKRRVNATLQQIGDTMITGGVDSMEKYKYMLGQAHAYQIVIQEISNLLEPKEQKNEQGNVIDLGKGSTKN